MNATPHIIESALLLLAAFLLGCLIGFTLRRLFPRTEATLVAVAPAAPVPDMTEPKPSKPVSAKPAQRKAAVETLPELLEAPRYGVADDLKKIKGIGPKLELLLNQNGVYHYDQIAGWNRKAVAAMNEKLAFNGRIERENWVAQAKVLKKAKSA